MSSHSKKLIGLQAFLVLLIVWGIQKIYDKPSVENDLNTEEAGIDLEKIGQNLPPAIAGPIPSEEPLEAESGPNDIGVATDVSEDWEEPLAEPTSREAFVEAVDTLRQLIAEDGKSLGHPSLGSDSEYRYLRFEIGFALEDDPSLLGDLIDLFTQDPNSLLGRELGTVLSGKEMGLGQSKAAANQVQAAAIDIVSNTSRYNREQRVSALYAIGDMDRLSAENRDRLLENLIVEEDPEIQQYSLKAMKPAPSTAEDYERVHTALASALASDDKNIRTQATSQIANWATSAEDLAPIRTLAKEDQDPNVRATAIMSISDSPFKSPDNKAMLWEAANNQTELLEARESAWRSLLGYPLTESEIAEYQTIGTQIKQAISAEREISE